MKGNDNLHLDDNDEEIGSISHSINKFCLIFYTNFFVCFGLHNRPMDMPWLY